MWSFAEFPNVDHMFNDSATNILFFVLTRAPGNTLSVNIGVNSFIW